MDWTFCARIRGIEVGDSFRGGGAARVAAAVDGRRCALTIVHFPEGCSLRSDTLQDRPWECKRVPASKTAKNTLVAAGYDPAFILPFCVQVLFLLNDLFCVTQSW